MKPPVKAAQPDHGRFLLVSAFARLYTRAPNRAIRRSLAKLIMSLANGDDGAPCPLSVTGHAFDVEITDYH